MALSHQGQQDATRARVILSGQKDTAHAHFQQENGRERHRDELIVGSIWVVVSLDTCQPSRRCASTHISDALGSSPTSRRSPSTASPRPSPGTRAPFGPGATTLHQPTAPDYETCHSPCSTDTLSGPRRPST